MTVLYWIHLIVLFCLIRFTYIFDCVVSDSVNVLAVFFFGSVNLTTVLYSIYLIFSLRLIRLIYLFDFVVFDSIILLTLFFFSNQLIF